MRLIELLHISEPVTEVIESLYKVPLFYLGGSVQDYNNYRSTRLFESLSLNEAAISRFKPMIQVFSEIDSWGSASGHDSYYDVATEKLEWAMRVLNREDRITWYMRIVKGQILYELMNLPISDNPNREKQKAYIKKEYNKAIGKLTKLYGDESYPIIREVNSPTFYRNIEHFISMNIPKIDATVWGSQSPHELMQHFTYIEKEWMSKKDSVIDMDDDKEADKVEVLIEFPDGHQWINLNRSSCDDEGAAMGHCGNAATNGDTETVLSLRQPVNERGQTSRERTTNHWRPRATFILETTTGMIGEMKGRNNQKPSDKLHPYIIGLLKLDIIRGIKGGGHDPANNFSLNDLDDDVKSALIESKPMLGSLGDLVGLVGVDHDDVRHKITSMLDVDFNENNEIIIGTYKNLHTLVDEFSQSDITKTLADIVLGEGDFGEGNYYAGDISERQELANDYYKTHPDELEHLKAYAKETYPKEFGYDSDGEELEELSDYDIDDIDDIISVLANEDDDIYDQIGWAITDGYRSGAESSMHDAFWQWVDDPFESHGSLYFDNPDQKYDSRVSVVLSVQYLMSLIDGYSDEGEFIENIEHSGWSDFIEITDITEPYYGWEGYDETVAVENFSQVVEIPKTDSYEIEHAGNAKAVDAKWFKNKIIEVFDAEEKSLGGMSPVIVTADDTRIIDVNVMNGVVVMNIYPVGENQDVKLAQHLRKISDMADERGVPVVIMGFNGDGTSNLVGEAGFKSVRHGYLRYDPPVTESNVVKLRGFGIRDSTTGDLDGFLDELYKNTQPHPFDRSEVLYGSIGLNVSKFNGNIHLGNIVNYGDKGAGHGTNALHMLLNMADKYKVSISGTAKAYSSVDGHIQDTNQLAKWYEKHGFLITGGYEEDGFDIVYHPDEESDNDETY